MPKSIEYIYENPYLTKPLITTIDGSLTSEEGFQQEVKRYESYFICFIIYLRSEGMWSERQDDW